MKKLSLPKRSLPLITALFFFLATEALAQRSPGAQGTTRASPGTSGQAGSGYPGNSNPGTDQGTQPGMSGNQSGNTSGDNSGMKGEKKMKGCVQSQGGQYVLETKKGKAVPLSGQDMSQHAGHQVAVHGTWGGSSSSSMSSASSGGGDSGKSFNVTSVDMISDTCGSKGKSDKSMNK
jgi:hypothetical protein